MDGWLTPEPNGVQHTPGFSSRPGRPTQTPLFVFDLTSPMTPMPGAVLEVESDVESSARILQSYNLTLFDVET